MSRVTLASDGQVRFPVNVADPTDGVAADMYYNSATSKFRAFINGVWKNLAVEDAAYMIGRTITVDPDHPLATDTRTGISPYSQSIPFKTITAACGATTPGYGETVYVRRCTAGYTGDVTLDPNSYSGWTGGGTLRLEFGVNITGNIRTLNTNWNTPFNIIGEGMNTITGSVYGTYAFILGFIRGVTITAGLLGTSSLATTTIIDCTITWTASVPALKARSFYSRFNFVSWDTLSLTDTTRFTYCELLFSGSMQGANGGLSPGSGPRVDLTLTNCKLDINGFAFNETRSTMRFLLRSCYVRFTGFLFDVTTGSGSIYAAHETKFVNRNTANDMITGGPGTNGWMIEHINTARTCPLGITTPTVASNDVQVVSITEFSIDGFNI